jgi:hypothetical protein
MFIAAESLPRRGDFFKQFATAPLPCCDGILKNVSNFTALTVFN